MELFPVLANKITHQKRNKNFNSLKSVEDDSDDLPAGEKYFMSTSVIFINPLTPRSDQCVKSPHNFNTLSSRQVIRIKKIINWGILFGYKTKFSVPANKEIYGLQLGALAYRSLE